MNDSVLLAILIDLEQRSCSATLQYKWGSSDEVQVHSTMHAQEGGDVIVEVVRSTASTGLDEFSSSPYLNVYLEDVDQVIVDGGLVFDRTGRS